LNLKEKIKNLPSSPGVYLMKDSHGSIIYVGKSKHLKQRVQSYFQNSKNHPPKIIKLVNHLKDFDYILTDTEFEAFLLECQLIKEIKPIYNTQMKNPLSYAYIVIKRNGKNRIIETANYPIQNDGHVYFGPYTSKSTVEKAVQGLKECFKIDCSSPSNKGLCMGMCLGGKAVEQYHLLIDQIIRLLNGSDRSLLAEMEQRMADAAEAFHFEKAAKYRDHINTVKSLLNKEKMIEFTLENKNMAIIEYLNDNSFKLFLIKGKEILYCEKYFLENKDIEHLCLIIKEFILTYFHKKTPILTKEISRDEIDKAQIIYRYLKSSLCNYMIIPEKWLNPKNISNIDKKLTSILSNNKDE
jgi:excinuclease ABC subunit C